MWRGVHGMWRYVERNVKWDAMRDVAWCIMWRYQWCDSKYGISGIVCCERCWCDMKWAIWWGMMLWRGMWPCDVEMVRWCNVKCGGMMWRSARCNDNVLHWHSTSHHHSSIFHIEPHFRHSTSFHITHFTYFNTTRSHGVMSNLVWCATF